MSLPTVAMGRRNLSTAGVAAPDDKRFRRPDVRPGGRRRIGVLVWRVARVSAVAVAALGIGYLAITTVMASSLLAIGRVAVRGNTRLSTAEVDALMQGIRGQNILSADLNEYQRRLMDSPWVAAATMRRVLPGTIEVRILERTPMAIARIDGRLYLVDAEGVIVDGFGPEYVQYDLPLVDGLTRSDAQGVPTVDRDRAELTRQFLQALQAAGTLRQRVSQVDVSSAGDVAVLLDTDATVIHLGDTRFVERLRTYDSLAPTLRERLREIDYVDMRFDQRVYVKSKGKHVTMVKPNDD
jgi:cell division protein FtsQ